MGILDKQFNQFYDLLKEAMDASNEEIEKEVKSDLEQEENEREDDVQVNAEDEKNEDIILNTFEDEFEELTDDMIEDSEDSFLEYEDEDSEEEDEISDEELEAEKDKIDEEEIESDDSSEDEESDDNDKDDPGKELANAEPPKEEDQPKKDLAEDFIPFVIESLNIEPDDIKIVNNKFKLFYEGMHYTLEGTDLARFVKNEILIIEDQSPEENSKIQMLKSYEKMFEIMDKDNNIKYTIPQDRKVMKIINKKTGEQYTTKQYFGDREYEIETRMADPDYMVSSKLPDLLQGWIDGSNVRDDRIDMNPSPKKECASKEELELAVVKYLFKEAEEYENAEDDDDAEINAIINDFNSDDAAVKDPNGDDTSEDDMIVSLANESLFLPNSITIRNYLKKKNILTERDEELIKVGMISNTTLNRISRTLLCEYEKVLSILEESYIISGKKLTVFKEESLPEMKREEINDLGRYQKFKNRVGNLLDLKRKKQQLEDDKDNMDKNELKRQGKSIADEKKTINGEIDTVKSRIDNEKEELNLTVSKYERKK